MKCAVIQPSYVPWRGYFDLIMRSDVFVFYDDVQYDKSGWRNRNRVKTPNGVGWLTIPVVAKGNTASHLPIHQARINPAVAWAHKHWTTLEQSYRKAPYFSTFAPLVRPFYERPAELLVEVTIPLTIALARAVGITHTRFVRSSELGIAGAKTDRLIAVLRSVGATHYYSGPSARDYIEADKFADAGIALEYVDYRYAAYTQLYPPYEEKVSILDTLFMLGPATGHHIRSETA
jgi:hypothetical protein